MKLLLNKDLILGFIKQDLENQQHQRQIRQILDNEQSKFIFSKKFFLFIKEELGDEYLNEYERLFTKFSDLGININSSQNAQNFDDEILHLSSSTSNQIVNNIAYHLPSQKLRDNISNIAILSHQQKPNYNWLIVNLAILHPNKVTVRCFEFESNDEITQFFIDSFTASRKISIVNIFDTQCNLNHDKFDYIINNSIKVKYFTKFSSREKNQFERRDDIKDHFGDSAKVFLSNRGKKAHGRRIIFENFIITTDDDFWNLEVNASDWNIDFEFCSETATKWLDRTCDYSQFY